MYITEQYHLYRLANRLVTDDGFEVIYMNDQKNELWLEKYEKKSSKVIRLVQQGFDWKNHLKTDIAHVFQRTKAMKRHLMSDRIEIFNVYVTSHEPVDDWEALKSPLQLKEKKPLKMKVFYLSKENYVEEETRLLNQIDVSLPNSMDVKTEPEQAIEIYKQQLSGALEAKQAELKNVFTYGKPRLLYLFIIVNVLMFLMLELTGGSVNIDNLIENGAKYNPAIIEGEWWRIVSSMFLHIGFFHLFMNMLALYYLGIAVEGIYGSQRFLIIYFLSGIGGGLTSFAFNDMIAAGASGAIFGLFGALLLFGTVHQRLFKQTMGKNLILILVINLVLGLMIPQIDMGAHMGGLIMGFVAAGITSVPNRSNRFKQLLYGFIYIVGTALLIWYGIIQNMHYL